MSTLAIFVSLLLLMFFAYRGFSVLLLAPLMAALAVLLSGDALQLLPLYTETFMGALGGYIIKFLPVFLLGALFGQLIADSGAATSISRGIMRILGPKHALLTVVSACALLTYGGVSLFVVAFAIYPVAKQLFQTADIPKRLIPPAIALGSFTFTMTAMPGTPSIQNAIPIPFFGTDAFAAPGLGLIASLIMFGGGMLWLNSRAAKARANGEGYGEDDASLELSQTSEASMSTGQKEMPLALALLPLVLVIGVNALFTFHIFPSMDFGFLKASFPELDPGKLKGLWAVIIALTVACASLVLLRMGQWKSLKTTVNKGVLGSMLPIFNTASEVGYGAVIASMAGFALIRDAVLNVSPGNPLISEAIAVNVLAGITGSSSGGALDRTEDAGAHLPGTGQCRGHQPRAAAPGGCRGSRLSRYPAPLRCRDHTALDLRPEPSPVLRQHRDADDGCADDLAGHHHHARHDLRFVLKAKRTIGPSKSPDIVPGFCFGGLPPDIPLAGKHDCHRTGRVRLRGSGRENR